MGKGDKAGDTMLVSITPAFNEEQTISEVIKNTRNYVNYCVVVDDCSTDNTWLKSVKAGAHIVIINEENMGQGFSLKKAMKFAINFSPDAVVSVDADLQHDPKMIPRIVAPIINDGYDVVVGSRLKEGFGNMPFVKRVGNVGLNVITRVLFGIKCTDSQSGFRAYSPKAMKKLDLFIYRYGWASIMYSEISDKHLKYYEVPIECIYHDPRKGTTVMDGLWIGMQLFNYKRMHLQKRILNRIYKLFGKK